MYLLEVQVENVRSIRAVTWALGDGDAPAGWHVVLGTNGSGKSTLLRAIALALVGERQAQALRQSWGRWLTDGASRARVAVRVHAEAGVDVLIPEGDVDHIKTLSLGVTLERREKSVDVRNEDDPTRQRLAERHRNGKWFSTGYGPFRRFSGGDKEMEKLFTSNPLLARHLTLFGEQVALTECIGWLQRLQFESLEATASGQPSGGQPGELLAHVRTFVNQPGFLPNNVRLDRVTSSDVLFLDGNGRGVPVEQLSDGFRSILSLVFELIRQLAVAYGASEVFASDGLTVVAPGLVLIDEIDAHLHPSWQRDIGFFLTRLFPRLQFVVTTHSPLVCHAAAHGSIFRLARPGVDEESLRVSGAEYDRLVYGNVLDAYGTESFGRTTGGPSREGRVRRARLASLNVKEMEEGLTQAELLEREQLRAAMPSSAGKTAA